MLFFVFDTNLIGDSIIVQNENLFLLIDSCNEHKWVTYSPFYRVAKQYTLIIDENNPGNQFQWSILSFKKKSDSAMISITVLSGLLL